MSDIEKMPLGSMNIIDERIEQLRQICPECFIEGKIDFEKLQRSLGQWIEPGKERFGLNWPGKAECMRVIQTPSVGTLLPMREESVNFDTTENLIIEGDNLEVLKLLQKSYFGKVKMIYIDPPYNTGHEFIYPDNYREGLQEYLKFSGQIDAEGYKLSANAETEGRYHSKWLSMMYPRLFLARNLLRDDGIIFVSIDDSEVHNLRELMNEVFGEENFIVEFIWKSKSGGANDSKFVAVDHEYVIAYAKESGNLKFNPDKDATVTTNYNLKDEKGEYALDRLDKQSLGYVQSLDFPIIGPDGQVYTVFHKDPNNKVARWRWGQESVATRYDELVFRDGFVYTKNYRKDGAIVRSLLIEERFGRTRTGKTDLAALMPAMPFDNPKPPKLVQFLTQIATSKEDIVLDFFAGSGTTAQAVFQQNNVDGGNRKYILVQLPEQTLSPEYPTIAHITRERLRRVVKKLNEVDTGKLDLQGTSDQDCGFRALRLSASNFKVWDGTAEKIYDVGQSLLDYADHIDSRRSHEDILYELLLKAGFPLTAKVDKLPLAGGEVYSVAEGALLICLEEKLTLEVIEAMVDMGPSQILCLDKGFQNNDQLKVNAIQAVKSRNRNEELDIVFRVV
jgi:adenine-specific DNA-methyltransferase